MFESWQVIRCDGFSFRLFSVSALRRNHKRHTKKKIEEFFIILLDSFFFSAQSFLAVTVRRRAGRQLSQTLLIPPPPNEQPTCSAGWGRGHSSFFIDVLVFVYLVGCVCMCVFCLAQRYNYVLRKKMIAKQYSSFFLYHTLYSAYPVVFFFEEFKLFFFAALPVPRVAYTQ